MVNKEIAANKGENITQYSPFDRFKDALEIEASLPGQDANSGNISAAVVGRIMESDDLDAALDAQDSSLSSGKDMVDRELLIHDFEVRKGDPKFGEHGLGYYVVVHAADMGTGEQVDFATGAPNLVSILWKIRETGNLPFEGVIRSRETANGALLSLKRVPKRVVKG